MANMHLVTGYAGTPHISSVDQGALNMFVFGSGEFVTNFGKKLAATVISNNVIRIEDGDLIMKGRHARLNKGSYVDLTIENGEQGYNRNDLIVARYTKDVNTSVEQVNLVVIKGTPVASTETASDPAYTNGLIMDGSGDLHDMPLYRVPLTGLNVGELECLFTTVLTIDGRLNQKADKNHASVYDSFGVGTKTAYGHLKLSSDTSDTSGVNGGVAAAPFAVNKAYTKAVDAENLANAALPKTGGTISGNLTVKGELNGLKIKAGWKIVQTSGNGAYHTVFTSSELNTLFGTSGVQYDESNSVVIGVNGDYTAIQKTVVTHFSSSAGNWYVRTTDGTNFPAGQIRVNYIAVTW